MANVFYVSIAVENPDDIGHLWFNFGAWREEMEADAFLNDYTELRNRYLDVIINLEQQELAGGYQHGDIEDDPNLHTIIGEARNLFHRYASNHQKLLFLFNQSSDIWFQWTWNALEGVPLHEGDRDEVDASVLSFELHIPSDY